MTQPSRFEAWYGRDVPPPAVRSVRRDGMALEVHGIDVRRMQAGSLPLVDRIYVAVRDPDWGTIPPVVSDVEVGSDSGHPFRMTFDARHEEGPIAFSWRGSITLDAEGVLTYDLDGVAESSFRYNRIGLCVLHPAGAWAGKAYRADTADGQTSGVLPDLIEPQWIVDGHEQALFAPFTGLSLTHEDLELDLRFEGDLFETEDQRNWTDDSFKTYSTPIALGYPHSADAGQHIRQRVTIAVRSRSTTHVAVSGPMASPVELTPGAPLPVWPAIGLGASSDDRALGPREGGLLRRLSIDHIRVDVRLADEDWRSRLDRAREDARVLGTALEVGCLVRGGTDPGLPALADALRGSRVARVLVFDAASSGIGSTPTGLVRAVRDRLGQACAGARWIGGTDGDFADMNRARPDLGGLDGICWSVNPQIHASDELSMAETLAAQPATVATARSFAGDGDTAVSPVTLKQRFNPVAEGPPTPPPPGTLPPGVDLRQPSLFGAAWALGSLASLVEAQATSVTLFETAGWRGLLEWTDPPDRPGWPAWTRGRVFPMYHVLADLGGRAAGRPVPIAVSSRDIVSLGIDGRDGLVALVANLRSEPVDCELVLAPGGRARVRVLDEDTIVSAMDAPEAFRVYATETPVANGRVALRLGPYASARVDVAAASR